MIRVSVIGAGGMGAHHARNIADLAGAQVAWVADPDEQAGRVIADAVGASWAADGNETFAHCDAVVIASPDPYHAASVLGAIDRGLPILCEKPLTVELDEAKQILQRESDLDRRLVQLGFMRVYDDRHLQVRQALHRLGQVNHVRCVHRNANSVVRPVEEMLVGSLVHDIHTVRWLSGEEIRDVFTLAVHRDRGVRLIVLTCRLSGGGTATIEFDDAAVGYEVSVEVSAERGNVVASEPHRATVRSAGSVSSPMDADWFAPFLGAYRVEMRSWLDSIEAGTVTGPTAWDGYAAQAVVAAAIESNRSGQAETVSLPPQPPLYRGERS